MTRSDALRETNATADDDRGSADVNGQVTTPSGILAVRLFVAAFVAAEAMTVADIRIQAVAHAAIVTVALSHALRQKGDANAVALFFGSLAASRLATLAIPLEDASTPVRTAVAGVLGILIYGLATAALTSDAEDEIEVPVPRDGRIAGIPDRLFVLLTAVPIAVVAGLALNSAPLVHADVAGSALFSVVVAAGSLVVGALAEELLYRRLPARVANGSALGLTPLLLGMIWGSTYIGNGSFGFVVLAIAVGIFWSWAHSRTRSLSTVVGAHAVVNIVSLMVLPSLL